MRPPISALIAAAAVLLESACMVTVFVKDTAGDGDTGSGSGGSTTAAEQMSQGSGGTSEAGSTSSSTGSTSEEPQPLTTTTVFDVGGGEDKWDACTVNVAPCDRDSEELDHALGLNCEDGVQTSGPLTWSGADDSRMVIDAALGTTTTFDPIEGKRRVVLSTGVASHVLLTLADMPTLGNCPMTETCPSTDAPGNDLTVLPAPLDPEPLTCLKDQVPPGPGDCSDTVKSQWSLGGEPLTAYDYTELRFKTTAPIGTAGLAFQFAFLTAEYPPRFPGGHNDLFVAWVASERYTGNVALDPQGYPIGAETLPYDIKFDPMPFECGDTCPDIPLREFAFEGHAGKAWIPVEIGINPGEAVEVVFALFDVGDPKVDSAVLLDGVKWLCAPPPSSV